MWWAALVAVTVVRLVVAGALPLSPDEAYYWVWSKALAPGYLDHPPMVALWIRVGTWVLGDSVLGVRLLAPLAAAGGTVLLADAGRVLFGGAAGVRAAVLLNATVMLGVGAVTMTPDTPLLLFWTGCVWALARVAAGGLGGGGSGRGRRRGWRWRASIRRCCWGWGRGCGCCYRGIGGGCGSGGRGRGRWWGWCW